ncbi:MAG: nucleotidyltransferase domain-containing protein [Neofamilia sp.]
MKNDVLTIKSIQEKTTPIFKKYPVEKVILFGSYAKGNFTKNSDIDMYIDSNGELRGLDFVGLLEDLVVNLEIDVDLIDKTHIEPGSRVEKEISSGLVIYEKSKNNQ